MTKKEELIEKINILKKERDKLKNLANIQYLSQMAYKLFLNSIYGVFGSVFYPGFDLDNAEAVTLSGQTVTREMVRYTNEILNKLVNKENEEYVIAGDTDSVASHSIVKIKTNKNINKLTIEQLWNQYTKNNKVIIDENNKERIELNNNDQIEGLNGWTNISKIFRHKVNKNRWKIGLKNKQALYITEDHSIIVYRNNQLIECKPNDILPTDYILTRINNNK